MKSDKKILVAFILNAAFSLFEFLGGIFTGSVAIISDSVHDLGDAISIGLSYALERKSKKPPDKIYTYGYARFSVLGSFITSFILFAGSIAVIFNAVNRILNPAEIKYNEMIIFALFGVLVNFIAAVFTKGGHSMNQRAVNLHMFEDVLGWIVVLIGAVTMKFTDFTLIDPIMSIGVAIFILINAIKALKEVLELFLEKSPVDIEELTKHILEIDGVIDVHHIHIRSLDGQNNFATMHIVAAGDFSQIKEKVREELTEHGIAHSTIEIEEEGEECMHRYCKIEPKTHTEHHHH